LGHLACRTWPSYLAAAGRIGGFMELDWQRDLDAAQREAKDTNRPLLLDFSAAPT
jgi:hypothetical protein